MSEMTRREVLLALAALPLAAALNTTPAAAQDLLLRVRRAAERPGPLDLAFFTPEEFRTVTMLADMIIPRDERSGSASDAGVPAFLDFTLDDRPALRDRVRGGLAWLDAESRRRFGRDFHEALEGQRKRILDDIAWPARAPQGMEHGVAFFNLFRDLVASGFYSSKIGVEDLRYLGNRPMRWNGCPPEALHPLGVRYHDA